MEYCLGDGDGTAAVWTADPNLDLNGDGEFDAIGLDFDGDGLLDDALADLDGDGLADHAVLDLDDDGHAEASFTDDGSGTWALSVDSKGRGGEVRWFGLDGAETVGGPMVDFDGDGAADDRLLDADRTAWPTGRSSAIRPTSTPTATGSWDVRLADSDGDGAADLPPSCSGLAAASTRAFGALLFVHRPAPMGLFSSFIARPQAGPRTPARSSATSCASAPLGRHVEFRPRPALRHQHAEVLGRTGDALGGVGGTPRPGRSVGREQFDEERLGGRGQPVTANAKSLVRTPMWAIDLSRAVAGRVTPSASATSRPCAQVSIRRAVAIDAALIGGPNHGSLRPSATRSSSS